MGLVSNFSRLNLGSGSADPNTSEEFNIQRKKLQKSEEFWFSIRADLESVDLEVDLENEGDHDYYITLSLQMLDVRYVHVYKVIVFLILSMCWKHVPICITINCYSMVV